ncbi:hypothetical protein CR194_13595 [Salipaludibacillus keqinensis]|uniref:VanZ-like domain-containing protein n=1 Tax=Salipaludibacillus keqinensis TaxID=2045207 RepID=A0A323TBX8_9BACI|nr:VanZ family protein [Salipaludibacillus keqinensis]PYZ92688.1 hypothetical protein CR194_13595 [Salipaludibacillus keqinensis]
MRYILLLVIFISSTTIVLSILAQTGGAVDMASIRGIYKEDASPLFMFDPNSSFYYFYSFAETPDLISRKFGHFIVFGLLASSFFLIVPLRHLPLRGVIAIICATSIGIIDEFHQYFLVARSGLVLDIVINFIGSTVFVSTLVIFLQPEKIDKTPTSTFNLHKQNSEKLH